MAKPEQRGKSRANRLRHERQEALREQLQAQGHLQHVVDLLTEMALLTGPSEESDFILKRNGEVVKHKLSLIKKYCPDLQNIAHEGEIEQKTILVDLSGEQQESQE